MAGHSHWANIKHKKKKEDRRKAKIFSRCSRAIIVAAREGGGDPETNLQLQYAIDEARSHNVPNDTIERAIKKGTGELEGGEVERVVYEGYGPGGTAFIVECMTDNRNRSAADVRKVFEEHGGEVASPGAVTWMFEKKGLVTVSRDRIPEDRLLETALAAGCEDVETTDGTFRVITEPKAFGDVRDAIDEVSEVEDAELTMIPNTNVELDEGTIADAADLFVALDDLHDVQSIATNFALPDDVAEEVEED